MCWTHPFIRIWVLWKITHFPGHNINVLLEQTIITQSLLKGPTSQHCCREDYISSTWLLAIYSNHSSPLLLTSYNRRLILEAFSLVKTHRECSGPFRNPLTCASFITLIHFSKWSQCIVIPDASTYLSYQIINPLRQGNYIVYPVSPMLSHVFDLTGPWQVN